MFLVGRVLEREECPLQVQSQWSVGEQNIFTLTRDECKVNSGLLGITLMKFASKKMVKIRNELFYASPLYAFTGANITEVNYQPSSE